MNILIFCDQNGKYGGFSNWYKSDFIVNGREYWCVEQYMLHQKALLLGDEDTAEKIIRETNEAELEKLREYQISEGYDEKWDYQCEQILRRGLVNKFMQNETLKNLLLSTDDSMIAACLPADKKFGIGMEISDTRVIYPHQWYGRNILGYGIMAVRNFISRLDEGRASSCELPSKDISVIKADITTLNVDIIVNAANKSLLGGGGVDGAIHRAAGPELLKECRTLNGAETGEVKMTGGYNLLAGKVIHTPGPIWRGGNNNEDEQLANCWRRSLHFAMEEDFHSIAFPSISTGIYGFPVERAAKIAMKETIEFLFHNPDYPLKIIVAAFDRKTEEAYKQALEEETNKFVSYAGKDGLM